MTADEMRVELSRILGGDRVQTGGGNRGVPSRTVEVYNQGERLRRFDRLDGSDRAILMAVLSQVRAEKGIVMETTTTGTGQAAAAPRMFEDDRYEEFRLRVQARFTAAVTESPHLFTTDAELLWEQYLDAAPAGARQERTCNACKAFIERFGGLATVRSDGTIRSVIWPIEVPEAYALASVEFGNLVARSRITGVFRSGLPGWGQPITCRPVTKPFQHLAVTPPSAIVWRGTVTTAEQEMADRLQQYEMLQRSLAEFPIDIVRKATALLTSGQLHRSEKHEGIARWLLDLHERIQHGRRDALVWLAVAGAPPGFTHVRSGMLGALLEDVASGMAFDTLKRRHDEKMDPLAYQRPQAAPSLGNIAQAEKIVSVLRTAGALDRRFATLRDVTAGTVWVPKPAIPAAEARPGEVFGHLKGAASAEKPLDTGAPPTTMTWTKFRAEVLPLAERIEAMVSPNPTMVTFVTATNPDAPPLLQWDREERRNPVSWYCIAGTPSAGHWGLVAGVYCPVTAIVLQPTLWDPERTYANQGAFACLVLKGARDSRPHTALALFPECLRSEYHAVRSTIEAYSNRGQLTGREEAEVSGIDLRKAQAHNWNVLVRVVSRGIVSLYRLDRWD